MSVKNIARRVLKGGLALAVAASATLGLASTAQAEVIGTLTSNPTSGSEATANHFTTSAPCDAGTAIRVDATGPGVFSTSRPLVTTNTAAFSLDQPISVPMTNTWIDVARQYGGPSATMTPGEYTVTLTCIRPLPATSYGSFTMSVFFDSPTHFSTTNPNESATALTVSPTGQANAGDNVTLTATVTAGNTAGTVRFKDGGNDLGAPAVVNNGVATLSVNALGVGAHALSAEFVPTTAGVNGSVSATVNYTIVQPVAVETQTALSVNPSGSVVENSNVTLTATVTPANATGSVQFKDGGNNLGSAVVVVNGVANLSTSTLSVGQHSFTATFMPANPAAFISSNSAAVGLEVTAFTGVSDSQDITTTVEAGALTISVANRNVTLPSPTMLPDASMLTTEGSLNPVTVTDTRAGNPGWNVSGQVGHFSDGANHEINGGNLGWTPVVVDKAAAQNITAGGVVAPADAIAPGVTAPGDKGLFSARTMAVAGTGGGNGTAHLNADVRLFVPTSTVAGTYTAVLTLTAI